jgi:3-dehydroquinate synthase
MAEATRLRVGPGATGEPPVSASTSGGGYDVLIGHDLTGDLPGLLTGAQRVLVVGSAALPEPAAAVAASLADAGLQVHTFTTPDAEAGKTVAVLEAGWRQLATAGFTRSDAVVGVGGGAVTDLAGFLAASWLRGVRVVQVATTVVGMVDAAVGGKTGINLPEGKNLVGAFHPPTGVLCDLSRLRTLPRADLVAGLAEVVKCGFIDDPVILDLVEGDLDAATRWDSAVLRELVERAVAVKARVVTADLTESGLREILNYGHTFGHAVEQVEAYSWRHGDAVAVGMVYAAELGVRAGVTPDDVLPRTRELLARLGLPTGYQAGRWEALHAAMRRDKKTRGDRLRFVVLAGIGTPQRLEDPDPSLLEQAYAAVCALPLSR